MEAREQEREREKRNESRDSRMESGEWRVASTTAKVMEDWK